MMMQSISTVCSNPEASIEIIYADAALKQPLAQYADFYKRHGYVILPTCIDEALVDQIKLNAIEVARSKMTSGHSRCSINDKELIFDHRWFMYLAAIVDPDGLPGQVMDKIYGSMWWFNRLGGEVVAPGAGFTKGPCQPHSDWTDVADGCVACSLFVHGEISPQRAPLVIWSKDDKQPRVVNAP